MLKSINLLPLKRFSFVIFWIWPFFSISNAQQNHDGTIDSRASGIFKTFEDFKDSNLEQVGSIRIDSTERKRKEWKHTYSRKPYNKVDGKKVKRIWGFYNGKHSYISFANDFFKIYKNDDYYYFAGYAIQNIGAGYYGGLLGALFEELTNANIRKDKTHRYILSPKTGTIYLSVKHYKDAEYGKIILYRKNKKEDKDVVQIKVGTGLWSFVPNSYKVMYYPDIKSTVDIHFGDEFIDTLSISFEKERIRYIEISSLKKEKKATVTIKSKSEGEFYSHKPRKAQEKRDKN